MSRKDFSRSIAELGVVRALFAAGVLLLSAVALAAPPSFTGQDVRAQGPSTLVNLRGQGAIAGTAPINVQVNAVRVGGILSPLIGVLRAVLQPGVDASVCVEVTNLLGLDLTFLGVEIDVTAFNAEAPTGISGRVAVHTGLGGEDTSPLACADNIVLPPAANAGPDQNLADTDGQPGELVTLNGMGSTDPDGDIAGFVWTNAAGQAIASGAAPTVRLADGLHAVTLTVTDGSGATARDTVNIRVTAPATNQLPIVDAGDDRVIADSDGEAGETITLDGSGSSDPDGTIASYQWLIGTNTQLASGATPTIRLPDGSHTLRLHITDNAGGVADDTVTITIGAADVTVAPIANAGGDRAIADTNQADGEQVTLDASASTDADGQIVSYQWFIGTQVIATGVTATVTLNDGESFITLVVTDDNGNTGSDAVLVTVLARPQSFPVANAGADQTVADSDGQFGENVTLNGSASTDSDGTIASYQWIRNGLQIAAGSNPTVRLADGDNTITLQVTDDDGNTASDTLLVTVIGSPQALPLANAGADRSIADSDSAPGENVVLDGSASSDADGTIVSYQWILDGVAIATGSTPTVHLPDGENLITLIVSDELGNTASDVVTITIAQPAFVAILSALPGLTENQRSVAVAMDTLCPRLQARAQTLAGDQLDLLRRCNAITFGSTALEQARALDQIAPEELNATRTQTLNLSRSQLINVADRLVALRKGAKGLSLVGLNLNTQDAYIPAEQVAKSLLHVFGGGASADEARESLFDDRLGLWLRGNYSFGEKSESQADHGFDADQWAVLSGIDYRVTPTSVVGLSLGYGRSQADFNPIGAGELATSAMTAALYTTMYSKKGFYVDAIASLLRAGYDSVRNLDFTEGGVPVDLTARGNTNGDTVGLAVTIGYDVNVRAFTIAPSIGYNYLSSTIDGFREAGAAGLDLRFENQTYVSGTANAGLRVAYAWKTGVGVIIPQVRGEYIREFLDERETLGVRFANDPFDDTPLMIVKTDVPDRSYWRLSGGLSAQFAHGISGFIEYQKLDSLRYFDYADIALGLRFEASFE